MLKKIISTILVLSMVLLVFSNGTISEASVKVTKKNDKVYTTTSTKTYVSYSTKSKLSGTIAAKAIINRTGTLNNGWTRITYKGKTAYVLSKNIKSIIITQKKDKVFITGTVTVRSNYSSDSKKLGSLKKGELVSRTGTVSNGWTRITYKGKKAYVLNSNVKVITITKKSDKVYTSGSVTVYSSYTTASSKLGTLKKGVTVNRTGVINNGWTRVTYNKKTAYVLSSSVTTKKPVVSRPVLSKKAFIVDQDVVRKTPYYGFQGENLGPIVDQYNDKYSQKYRGEYYVNMAKISSTFKYGVYKEKEIKNIAVGKSIDKGLYIKDVILKKVKFDVTLSDAQIMDYVTREGLFNYKGYGLYDDRFDFVINKNDLDHAYAVRVVIQYEK